LSFLNAVVDVDHSCCLQKLIIFPAEYTCEFRVVITRADNGSWVKWVNKFEWVMSVTGQYSRPVDPFYSVLNRYLTWFSGSWKTSNGNWNSYFDCLLVPFHNPCNSVARDELTTSETHRFPCEGPNSVEILGKKDW